MPMLNTRMERLERQRRHPVWRTRRVGGCRTYAEFSHWSDEEPPKDMEKREQRGRNKPISDEERKARAERQRRHPVWKSRRAGGMTAATFSHWSDEEPPKDQENREREKEQ